jgi:sulfofructose kinase
MQIIGLGLSALDILMRTHQMPTWEEGGHMESLRFDGGGPVGTALVAAARLGAQTGYIGTCGNDDIARLKMSFLTKEGIDTSQTKVRPIPEPQVVFVYVNAASGERTFGFVDRSDRDLLQPEELDKAYILSADYLHLDGFHFDAALQAAQWMKDAGKKVVLDAGKTDGKLTQRSRDLVALTDILICGSGFAPNLTGESDLWQAGRAALHFGPSIVVQTEGENGSYTVTAGEEFHTPAFKVAVVDTTGAGDVFHGAYITGLLQGWDLPRTALFASAVAAIKCTQLGGRAGIPNRQTAIEFLNQNGYHF